MPEVDVNIAESLIEITQGSSPATSQVQLKEVKVGHWKEGQRGLNLVRYEVVACTQNPQQEEAACSSKPRSG
jgi:hypothetical protein